MSAAPSIRPRLIVVEGRAPGLEYEIIEGGNLIGRADRADRTAVDIDLGHQEPGDLLISHEHARITLENNQMFIEDLYSAHGTSVNERLLTPGRCDPLPVNARIQIGDVRLRVEV